MTLVLTAAAALCHGDARGGPPRHDVLVDDFESGRYDKWTILEKP